jgi:hypothetical protein
MSEILGSLITFLPRVLAPHSASRRIVAPLGAARRRSAPLAASLYHYSPRYGDIGAVRQVCRHAIGPAHRRDSP